MTGRMNETLLLEKYDLQLKQLCKKYGSSIEPEDCLAEAQCLFLQAYRSWPIDSGHFLDDFESAFQKYLKANKASLTMNTGKKMLSLDAPLRTQTGDGTFTLLDCLTTI